MTPRVRRLATITVVGLLTGVLTQFGQSVLPDGWSQVANAISPWLFVAFLLGSTMPDDRWAAGAGAAALLLALVGYYAMTELRYGIGGGTGSLILWGTGAIVGGPVFGFAGHRWRGPSHRERAAAIGLVGAVAIAEGAYITIVLGRPITGLGFAIAGLVAPLLLGRDRQDRLGAYVAIVPALALGAVGYIALMLFADLIAGI